MRSSMILLSAVLFAVLTARCSDAPTWPPSAADLAMNVAPTSPMEDLLKAVRQATARYHSMTQATHAGYVAEAHCVQTPAGAMGIHWPKQSLMDANFNAVEPEVLLYAPAANGKQRLVAVEYVVIDIGQPRPEFAGQPFDIGGVPPLLAQGIPHWSLHVWLYEENPTGLFAPFNPQLSCT